MKISTERQPRKSSVSDNRYIEYEYDRLTEIQVSSVMGDNLNKLKEIFKNSDDIVYKQVPLGKFATKSLLVFINGMANKKIMEYQILTPLTHINDLDMKGQDLYNYVRENLLTASIVNEGDTFDKLLQPLLFGEILLFIDGSNNAMIIGGQEIQGRSVEAPTGEQTIRGPKEGFVESLQDNIALIRKRLLSPNLAVELLTVGKRSRNSVALVYLRGVIREGLPEDIKEKVKDIGFDGLLAITQVEQLIVKHKWSLFPQMLATERPDRTVGSILEGRAALVLNGTPFVIIIPTTFATFLTAPDDYYGVSIVGTFIRLIRYIGLFETTSLAAIYVALTAYHPGLIPTSLALSITGTRIGLPFPVVFEVLLMELSLYLLSEAAIRLPKPMAQTVGVVGGLVIGQSAVQAGIISPIIVIIAASSAIASYTIPNYAMTLSTIIIRLILIFCTATLGLYGYFMGQIFLLIHAASLENYGVKYLEDYSPFSLQKLKDTFVRAPLHIINRRPDYLEPQDSIKGNTDLRNDSENE